MKKILIFINVFIAASLFAQSLTNTENYLYSRTYLEPVASSQPSAKQIQSVQYLDGLGRTTQAVSIKNTPSGKDIVLPVLYDENGKVSKSYLPLPSNTLNGAKHSGITENSVNSYYGVTNAYSQIDYEKSPVAKIFKKSSPGEAWKINGPNTQNVTYSANSASEVKNYKAIASWDSASKINNITLTEASDSFTTNGYYNGNTLYKFVAKDEDQNITEIFVNSAGLQVLVRKINSATLSKLDTYYVYDQAYNLTFIIPPAAAKAQSITELNGFLDSLCYQYRYDKYNRLAESRLPGRNYWEYIVYDKQGRVALTQDSNQHNNAWSFVKYDKFDRPVYTGIYASSVSRIQLQNSLDNGSYASSNESLSASPFVSDGKNIYYTKTSFPSTGITVLSVNYYDEYPTGSPAKPATILGSNTLGATPAALMSNGYKSSRSTKSLPTASLVRNVENSEWTSTYVWYDQKGQVIGTHNINHLGGYTKTEMKLNFAGFPLEDYIYHKRLSSDNETVIKQRYTYDDRQRIKIHYHQVNNNPEEILSQREYDDMSRVTQKKVGGTSLSAPVETIDYSYNILGWETGINKQEFLTPTNKLFAYDIRYDNPVGIAPAKYNGNISEVSWKSSDNNIHKRYDYAYDAFGNLTSATYSEPSAALPVNNHYNETLQYDPNGNIARLTRNAPSFYGNNAETIDDLYYEYNGNKLNSVEDKSGNPTGYEGGKNKISYDSNGNMTSMPDKAIETISYNHLNLPNSIKSNENRKIVNYIYSADGTKLRKQFSVTGDTGQIVGASTDYIDGFYYSSSDKSEDIWNAFQEAGGQAYDSEAFMEFLNELSYNNVLKFIPTSEGFYDFENNKYIYQYKDQLGNVRVSFFKGSNGVVNVVDRNDYYPFGMNHIRPDDPSYFGFGRYTNYKYNGKELQETGMYDYGWRQYMPDLGRWYGMDQLSELYHDSSPYGYVGNNPIRFRDPNGKCNSDTNGNFANNNCAFPIEEVVLGKPKSTQTAPSVSTPYNGATFPGEVFSHISMGLGDAINAIRGGGGGGGGAGTPVDPWVQYRKDLAEYRLDQSRSTLYAAIGDPIDDVQFGFDVLGNIPVLGEVFDGVNGLIYLGRGQNVNAIASFSAMIPLIGSGAKYGIKGVAKAEVKLLNYGVKASWGKVFKYRHGGEMSAIEHIMHRHAYNSGFTNVSRFSQGTSVKMIKGYVDDAIKYGKPIQGGFEYNFGRVIGTGSNGEAASSIRVFIRDGWVKTAFPF
ncbi:DUF6443 domain-containing protein [Chryseobacterium profundimaris]|nr:DUF6443 domain-containing protein [Chryseobacterium profundimaris]